MVSTVIVGNNLAVNTVVPYCSYEVFEVLNWLYLFHCEKCSSFGTVTVLGDLARHC